MLQTSGKQVSLRREDFKYFKALTHKRLLTKVKNEPINPYFITTKPLGSPTGFILMIKGFKAIKQNCAIVVV